MVIMTRRQGRHSAIFGGKSAGRKSRKSPRHPCSMRAAATITEIEAFFHSKWFKMLTDTDPAYILDQLRKEEH